MVGQEALQFGAKGSGSAGVVTFSELGKGYFRTMCSMTPDQEQMQGQKYHQALKFRAEEYWFETLAGGQA